MTLTLRAPGADDNRWVVRRHGEIYAAVPEWDESFEALVAGIVADFFADHDAKREAAWIAEIDGQRVGCVFCVRSDANVAQLRLLLVEQSARGHGVGTRLIEECVAFARRPGTSG